MLRRFSFLFLLILFLAACRQEESDPTVIVETPAAATPTLPTFATSTLPLPTPTLPATATPTPEPQPALRIDDQRIDDSGRVLIQTVTSLTPSLLAFYTESNGEPGEFLTFISIPMGTSDQIELTLNPLQVTDTLFARLYADTNQDNIPDDPAAPLVQTAFTLDLAVTVPTLIINDQTVDEAGQLRLDGGTVIGPSWVVIHNEVNGAPGEIVGFYPLTPETSYPLTMTIRWREAVPQMQAMLYHDGGERGRFDPTTDMPLLRQGQPITVSFRASLPLDVTVLDQPVINNQIVIERVISNGPGWLVVYTDDGSGRPNLIIGYTHLEDGLNTAVTVSLQPNAHTSTLYIWLHEDEDTIGTFEYPRTDAAVRLNGRLPLPFSFRTNVNNYLIARDQMLTDGPIIVSHAVTVESGWVVIYNDMAGEPGEIIGQTWIPAGVSREIEVLVAMDEVTPTLYVALHRDLGQPQQFDEADLSMLVSGRAIIVPIFLLDN